ncbi:hypothetical protein MJ585_24550 [Klebsiella pneumoniae]|nr:hypothetical protein MJ585_24550 [Klebsiella pneumoniae]
MERKPGQYQRLLYFRAMTRHNLRMNGIDEESVRFQDSLSLLPAAPALVPIKVPKQLALLEQQPGACAKRLRRKTRNHRRGESP